MQKIQSKKKQKIKIDDLDFKRPGTGISPDKIEKVLGKIALRTINKETAIKIKDIK